MAMRDGVGECVVTYPHVLVTLPHKFVTLPGQLGFITLRLTYGAPGLSAVEGQALAA